MSYLLENSLVVSKRNYEENETVYLDYDKYEIDENYILTQNEKPFFCIYDIANYCKKKIKEEKLFLVVHRFKNSLNNENVTEFYIFNTIDIYEKSLTSFLTIEDKYLLTKQKMIQDNLLLAQQLTNQKNIHIILGDNIKKHEVIEYIAYRRSDDDIIIYDNYDFNDAIANKPYKSHEKFFEKSTVISSIINNIRIIEPKDTIIKRTAVLIIAVIISIVIAQDTIDDLFLDNVNALKKESKSLKKQLKNVQKDFSFKENIHNKKKKTIDNLNKKDVFKKDKN